MSEQWLVLKFGGTSVTGKRQWETIASLVQQRLDGGNRVLLVCSAIAGVTNALQVLAEGAGGVDTSEVTAIVHRHRQLSEELGVEAEDLMLEVGAEIDHLLNRIASAPGSAGRYAAIASLLSLGEWLATRIGERYLARSFPIEWVDACEALKTLPETNPHGRRAWLSARCKSGPEQALCKKWTAKSPVLITQGFVAAHAAGGTALLGRGGSDTSATLLASRLAAKHVEIWTDVPGLFSADPKLIPAARLLKHLNYDEALEMAASGAKVVHSRSIRAAAEAGIPILVRDLGSPGFEGTAIQINGISHIALAAKGSADGVRAVCHQSEMAVLLLQNLDTREHVGFLAWVFAQISEAGISVDLVATSETTTTVALNRTSNVLDDTMLETLIGRLRERCAVTVYPQCSGINLVGRGVRVALADIDPGSSFFSEHPLLMLSQSANDLCISVLVHSKDAEKLLKSLHDALIGKGLDATLCAQIFGPSWQELQN